MYILSRIHFTLIFGFVFIQQPLSVPLSYKLLRAIFVVIWYKLLVYFDSIIILYL